MNTERISGMTRRRLLFSSGCLVLAQTARVAAENGIHLAARLARARLAGEEGPDTGVWAYNGTVPGTPLRLKQGEPTRIIVENRLNQVTTVHWHGIRLPNAMDGVPGLTQPPIKPGESFVYEFAPPDAGTFWYHSHANSLEQLGRGLAGPVIVEEREPPRGRPRHSLVSPGLAADRGWRRSPPDSAIRMEAAMSGRVGNTVTLNGRVSETRASPRRRPRPSAARQCGARPHDGPAFRGPSADRRGDRRPALRAARAGWRPASARPRHARRCRARPDGRARPALCGHGRLLPGSPTR